MLGLVKKTDELINKTSFSEAISQLMTLYPSAESGQIESWKNLIIELKSSPFAKKMPTNGIVGMEYSLPIEGMGIDLFFAGRNSNGKNVIYLVECKDWNDIYISSLKFGNSRYNDLTLQPQIQVYRHYLAFKNYLSIGKKFDEIIPVLYISHCSSRGISIIKDACDNSSAKDVPIYNSFNALMDVICHDITNDCSSNIEDFINAEYSPSRGIVDSMKSIVSKEQPFILSKEQEEAVLQIKEEIKKGKRIIRIRGAAGSGKTAILLNLFVEFLDGTAGYKPYFSPGAQNFKLYQSLYPEVQKSFSSTFGLKNLANYHHLNNKSILFLDEAQHNGEGVLTTLLNTGAIIVSCYDASQVINDSNSGIAELNSFEKRPDFVSIELHESVRYNGSTVFEKNAKAFLDGATSFLEDDKFDFRIVKTLDELIKDAKNRMADSPNDTVALVGLLSNDSKDIIADSKGQLKTDWSQPYQGVPAEARWFPYIQNKKYLSNLPLWVGTWWLPGLDVDYIYLIVGGDAEMTCNGLVPIPNQAKHYKMMVSAATKVGIPMTGFKDFQKVPSLIDYITKNPNDPKTLSFMQRFTTLLKNNYYIMMTRARKGCIVYFKNNKNTY